MLWIMGMRKQRVFPFPVSEAMREWSSPPRMARIDRSCVQRFVDPELPWPGRILLPVIFTRFRAFFGIKMWKVLCKFPVLRIRIRDPVPFWPLDPESGMGKKSGSGSVMNNPDHISEGLETFFGLKYFNSLLRIRDVKNSYPGWKKCGFGIKIPDPQQW
jgi:hypothetical protein